MISFSLIFTLILSHFSGFSSAPRDPRGLYYHPHFAREIKADHFLPISSHFDYTQNSFTDTQNHPPLKSKAELPRDAVPNAVIEVKVGLR